MSRRPTRRESRSRTTAPRVATSNASGSAWSTCTSVAGPPLPSAATRSRSFSTRSRVADARIRPRRLVDENVERLVASKLGVEERVDGAYVAKVDALEFEDAGRERLEVVFAATGAPASCGYRVVMVTVAPPRKSMSAHR